MEQDFNLICLNFQEKIIEVFNEEKKLPFLIKFYLFKQIWKVIKKEKEKVNINTQMSKTQEKTLSMEIPLDNKNE